jgi:glycosyltransferase involved in cell wall biosynthesis
LWKYLGVDSEVVYPGVKVPETVGEDSEFKHGEYYFTISRAEEAKRMDKICEAFIGKDEELVVAGSGSQSDVLQKYAEDHQNIYYLGRVSEEQKWNLLNGAKATIFVAREEDFGLVPIESLAVGTPVIGCDEGFTRYQIQDGENGILITPTVSGISEAVSKFERSGGVSWTEDKIRKSTLCCTSDEFSSRLTRIVAEELDASHEQENNMVMGYE